MSEKPKKNQKVKIEVDKKFILMLLGLPPIDLTPENYLKWLKKKERREK